MNAGEGTPIDVRNLLNGDDPIDSAADDLLQRADLARTFAAEIRRISARQGAVVALTGRWGSGKTSLLNLAAETLEAFDDVQVITFNPWFFSGTDQLMRFFFDELASQLWDERSLKAKLRGAGRTVAEQMGKYSSALSPLKFIPGLAPILDGIGAGSESAARLLGDGQHSVHQQRAEITKLLADLPGRIVVFIDDIDRLSLQEIRDLFRLVRLTGSFPNIVYVLCFDRSVVEAALTDGMIKGSDYLEKIVRMSLEVPPLPTRMLPTIIPEGLAIALADLDTGPLNRTRWLDILMQFLVPTFSTIRDVKRYLASVPLTVRRLHTEVDLADILALEALRLNYPAAHEMLPTIGDLLTGTGSNYRHHDTRPHERRASWRTSTAIRMVTPAPSSSCCSLPPTRSSAAQVTTRSGSRSGNESDALPAVERWTSTCISNCPTVEPQAGSSTRSRQRSATQPRSPTRSKRCRAPQLEDVLKRIVPYLRESSDDQVLPIAVALMQQLPRVRPESPGMHEPPGEWVLLSLVNLVLRTLSPGTTTDDTVIRLSVDIPSLHGKHLLLDITAGTPDRPALISPETARLLREELRRQLHAATAETLTEERMLLQTVEVAMAATESPEPLGTLSDPRVIARILEDAVGVVRSRPLNSVVVTSATQLKWDSLTRIFGGDESLTEAVATLRGAIQTGSVVSGEGLDAALSLFDRYASGWRPSR
ncbi:P-loop NTPase fold protein [Kitasatospora sp. NPDC101157]|uniref:KAP family P-loop NTPase fold protein n=1 Tax=Kitasatospora sp. NPDC101157 TaxID=3364098 RepID=UPI0037F78AEB